MTNPNVTTLADLAFQAAVRYPNRTVLRRIQDGTFVDTSGRELLEQVRDLSLGLIELGVSEGDRIALVAENRPEWCVTDLAVQTAGAVTVPIYPTLTSAQVLHLLNDCNAKLAVVSSHTEVETIAAIRAHAPRLAMTIAMNADGRSWPEWVVTLADVAAHGHQRLVADAGEASRFQESAARIRPDAVATIIYTSGTEGIRRASC